MFARRGRFPILFAPLAFALGLAACLSLQKVPLGDRVIADFEEDPGVTRDGGIEPTWSVFSPWTCGATTMRDPGNGDAGQDGGSHGDVDAGQPIGPDGGQPVSCTLAPGDTDMHSLQAAFDLAAPSKGQQLAVEVATHTMSGTVGFTDFQQFLFEARLDPRADAFPTGTELKVELGCKINGADLYFVDLYLTLAPRWNPFSHLLSEFQGTVPLMDQTCLAYVDSIRFAVLFSSATGTSMTRSPARSGSTASSSSSAANGYSYGFCGSKVMGAAGFFAAVAGAAAGEPGAVGPEASAAGRAARRRAE